MKQNILIDIWLVACALLGFFVIGLGIDSLISSIQPKSEPYTLTYEDGYNMGYLEGREAGYLDGEQDKSFRMENLIGNFMQGKKIVDINTPVEVIKTMEVPVDRPVLQLPRQFENYTELYTWLKEIKISVVIKSDTLFSKVDCDDFALTLQAKALADGYIINVEREPSNHAMNSAIIGNDWYLIEPTNNTITHWTELD